jgi:hypothetical protein
VSGRQQEIPYDRIVASPRHGLRVVDGTAGARHSGKNPGHSYGFCPVQEIRLGDWLPGMPRPYARVEGLAREDEEE